MDFRKQIDKLEFDLEGKTVMNAGMITNCDSEYLAVKYYAPIYFYAQKWLFNGELTEESKDAFRIDAYKHIQKFFGEIEGYNG